MRTLGFALICLLAIGSAWAQTNGIPPSSAGPTSHARFVRQDGDGLAKLGNGDMVQGMNRLGESGYELFIVTTSKDDGSVGWLFFRQRPWNLPIDPPKFEYKQIDDQGIIKLGDGKFDDGLAKIENESWDLVAVTTTKNGGVGWYYFLREKSRQTADATPSPSPVVAPTVITENPFASGFATPKAAVQTFIAAALVKDADTLSKCFATNCEAEFKPLQSKTAPQKDLDDLSAMFQNAVIQKDESSGNKASVSVKLQSRDEEIELVKLGDEWKIVGF